MSGDHNFWRERRAEAFQSFASWTCIYWCVPHTVSACGNIWSWLIGWWNMTNWMEKQAQKRFKRTLTYWHRHNLCVCVLINKRSFEPFLFGSCFTMLAVILVSDFFAFCLFLFFWMVKRSSIYHTIWTITICHPFLSNWTNSTACLNLALLLAYLIIWLIDWFPLLIPLQKRPSACHCSINHWLIY